MKRDDTTRSTEVRRAEQEVELSNRRLSDALDRLKVRTDSTVAQIRRIGKKLNRAAHPVALASGVAARNRGFAWTGLGAVGVLSGVGVKLAVDRYLKNKTIRRLRSTKTIENTAAGSRDSVSEY
ncbi:MAG: hypothetical protein NDJ90_11280 [Oligoflexia bacterium]|nr:hypothetical protein [Oligoflexia bacterium]